MYNISLGLCTRESVFLGFSLDMLSSLKKLSIGSPLVTSTTVVPGDERLSLLHKREMDSDWKGVCNAKHLSECLLAMVPASDRLPLALEVYHSTFGVGSPLRLPP